MVGREQSLAPELGPFSRLYVRLFGYPALGLRIRARSILPLLAVLPAPTSVLDAGCGKGVFTVAAARLFPRAEVVGVDFSPDAIRRNAELACRLGLSNLRFEVVDLTVLEEQQRYDLILATDVLEHVADDCGLLGRFLAALRPGGRLLLHVPHETRYAFGWTRPNFMGIEGHVRPGYTLDGLRKMLLKAGFEVEQSEYNYNSIETLTNDISYAITGGRERRKALYAVVFPLLVLISAVSGRGRLERGSGLVFLLRRAASGELRPEEGARCGR